MSFVERLDRALETRRVPAATRRRIRLEYSDHVSCDASSEARLGDPRELARTFAAELAADDVRRTTLDAFLALSLAALALLAGQLTLGHAAGYPGFDTGTSIAVSIPALLMVLIGPQVALVFGLLAALRAVRRRGARQLPDAEVALIYRRCAVAVAAGLVTCAGLLLYALNFTQRIATWWLVLQSALALLAALALAAVAARARRAKRAIADIEGPAGGIADDLPPLRLVLEHPLACCGLATIAGLVGGTVLGAVAERSLIEGLERGTFEAVVIACALGLALALSRRAGGPERSEPAAQR